MTGQRGSRAKDVQCRPMGGRDRMPLCMLFRTEREKESHAQRQVTGCFLQSGAGSGRCGLQKKIPDYSTELA